MLTANPVACGRSVARRAFFPTATRSNIGSRDSDVTALAVIPCTVSPTCVLTTVTPVANRPIVFR
jgi:hypothetical protein